MVSEDWVGQWINVLAVDELVRQTIEFLLVGKAYSGVANHQKNLYF